MNILVKVCRLFGALIYATLFCVIVTFIMKWICKLVIHYGWIGDLIFLLLSGTFVACILALIVGFLSVPLLKLAKDSRLAKILCSILIIANGFGIIKATLVMVLQYGVAEIIGAVLCSLFVFYLYKSFIENMWLFGRQRHKVWDDNYDEHGRLQI